MALLDALVDALGRVHRARGREPLRVEGDEGACRVAALVVRRVVLVGSSAAAEEAQVLGGVRREAAAGFVDEEANESLALVDRVAVVALVRRYEAGARRVVKLAV